MAGSIIAVMLGARVGAHWSFHLMRAVAAIGAVLWVIDLVVGIALVTAHLATVDLPAGSLSASNVCVGTLVFRVPIAALGILLIRALPRGRWLEPFRARRSRRTPVRPPGGGAGGGDGRR